MLALQCRWVALGNTETQVRKSGRLPGSAEHTFKAFVTRMSWELRRWRLAHGYRTIDWSDTS